MKRTFKTIITKNFLLQKYVNEQLSGLEIGKILNCDWSIIYRYIKKFNIPLHPKKYNLCINCGNKVSDKCHSYCKKCINIFRRGENHQSWKGGNNNCEDCGKILSNRFSLKCKSCSKKGKLNPSYKNGCSNIKYYCEICEKQISDTNGRYGLHKCSSCACKGESNHQYIHGQYLIDYPPEFSDKKRYSIRKRDNFICQICNVNENEHKLKFKTNLHIHHIDYNKENNRKKNLLTLCHKCHIKTNGNRDYWYAYCTYLMEKHND